MSVREIYEDYAKRIGNRLPIYTAVQKKYQIQSALYPGSHVDIAPSFCIPHVTYVDNFKGTVNFFKDQEALACYVDSKKNYAEACELEFVGADYNHVSLEPKFDLVISQYAGFVGQATKKYLKEGGLLLCNDSHGDATLAYFDEDFEFVGVVDTSGKISSDHLEAYFQLAKGKMVDYEKVLKTMKGPKYVKVSENYLFRLISNIL